VPDTTTHADDDCPKSIALVGNPNCGKTTLFNGLTGSRYKVANYPGVTVERKEGSLSLPHGSCARIVDLPGTYALIGASLDEKIVTQFLRGDLAGNTKPDLIVAVVDATNLERNLFLVSELIDTGYPIVLRSSRGFLMNIPFEQLFRLAVPLTRQAQIRPRLQRRGRFATPGLEVSFARRHLKALTTMCQSSHP
jgi:hypothetical protein